MKFIKKNKILYELQFGFLENHSTTMALSLLTDRISQALDDGNISVGVFLDFSKAFDTVDHDIPFFFKTRIILYQRPCPKLDKIIPM